MTGNPFFLFCVLLKYVDFKSTTLIQTSEDLEIYHLKYIEIIFKFHIGVHSDVAF